jgi:hypothetical protein
VGRGSGKTERNEQGAGRLGAEATPLVRKRCRAAGLSCGLDLGAWYVRGAARRVFRPIDPPQGRIIQRPGNLFSVFREPRPTKWVVHGSTISCGRT